MERQRKPLCNAGPEVSISKQGRNEGHTYSPSTAADINPAVDRTVLRRRLADSWTSRVAPHSATVSSAHCHLLLYVVPLIVAHPSDPPHARPSSSGK